MTTAPPVPSSASAAHDVFYNAGLAIRTEVTGPAHVAASLSANSSDFARPMQDFVTAAGWGMIWSRPGLDRRMRSLLNIAMLCALNRMAELAVHVRGALRNGATEVEIRETLMQVAVYAGMPAGLEGVRVARAVLEEVASEREAQRQGQPTQQGAGRMTVSEKEGDGA